MTIARVISECRNGVYLKWPNIRLVVFAGEPPKIADGDNTLPDTGTEDVTQPMARIRAA